MKSIFINSYIANIIYLIHILLILFIFFGNFFIPNNYLPFFIIFIILIILSWNYAINVCILTKLEHYFRTGEWSDKNALDENGPEFFRPFITSITGIKMTRIQADKLNLNLFLLVIVISLVKYIINN